MDGHCRRIALDASYSLGGSLSGVGVYSRELMAALRVLQPRRRWLYCYRWRRFFESFREPLPPGVRRFLLQEPLVPYRAALFHGLNQRLPRTRMRRTAATFHDLFVMTGEYSSPEFRERFTLQAKEAAKRADLIIAVSRFTAGQVRDLLGVEAGRIRVIHHGTRPFRSTAGADPQSQLETDPKLDAPQDYPGTLLREPLVLNVGALQKRKNLVRLIQAFEEMPAGWRLVLAGSAGYEAGEVLAAAKASPRRADIQIPGFVSEAELEHLYVRASIFAFPSLDEGFGMPVLEAMSRGVPVLTSNCSALPEITGDAAVLVNPANCAAISAGLRRLEGDTELRQRLVFLGRERVRQFTWEKSAELTWAVYQELLA